VTTLACFLHYTRGCGRIERPAFPAPSDVQKAGLSGKTRAKPARGIAKSCLDVMRSKATKQSSFLFLGAMDCFASLAMTVRVVAVENLIRESVGWAKARLRRAHHVDASQMVGTLALCPPYGF
jgi:hypothetical protein